MTAPPPPPAPSVRRTTTHDSTRPHGLDGPVTVIARGRDRYTDGAGRPGRSVAARLEVSADHRDGTIARLGTTPPVPALDALAGTSAYGGFRRAAAAALAGLRSDVPPVLLQLADDLPVALLLSGRVLRDHGIGLGHDPARLPVDICAGWAAGGTLLAGITDLGPPLSPGPVVTDDEDEDDALPPDATRRRRRLDVWTEDGVGRVTCFFRDSHRDAHGVETAVHEYTVHARVDLASGRVAACDAVPGPLPYPECPGAAASAGRVVGAGLGELRRSVRSTFVGPTTCTHLNDSLRSLQDVAGLLASLAHSENV